MPDTLAVTVTSMYDEGPVGEIVVPDVVPISRDDARGRRRRRLKRWPDCPAYSLSEQMGWSHAQTEWFIDEWMRLSKDEHDRRKRHA